MYMYVCIFVCIFVRILVLYCRFSDILTLKTQIFGAPLKINYFLLLLFSYKSVNTLSN